MRTISQEPYIIWLSFIVHMCKIIVSVGIFFIFSKFLFFGCAREVKVEKMVQNDKKILSVVLSISGTIHHMIVIYITPVQNDNISGQFFYFFKILIFWVVREVKGQKWSKMIKYSVCCTPCLRNHTSCNCRLWYAFVKW